MLTLHGGENFSNSGLDLAAN